jgi:hypothetical protein
MKEEGHLRRKVEMSSARRAQWKGPLLWFLWGALMGFGMLGIFSIGIFVLLLGVGLLVPLARGGLPGGWMALIGAATPWAVFAVEGIISPDCASGNATITPSGEEHFNCDVMHSSTELVPFLLVSVGLIAIGLVPFFLSRRRISSH